LEAEKSQRVRFMDVFALGPFMVWYAGKSRAPPWAKGTLFFAGIGTILYNWRNYAKQRKADSVDTQNPFS
jgi:hypothetical protein